MFESLAHYFGTSGFSPHGYCFFWSPLLLWTYVLSDLTIAASYFSIPFALWYFVRKRPDIPFRWIFVLFGAFVMACGSTHLIAVWNIWHVDYWADAGLKAVTAGVSLVTAIVLWPLIPKALMIPSRTLLEGTNRELQIEVTRRTQAEGALRAANDELERRVLERTTEVRAREAELTHFRLAMDAVSDAIYLVDRASLRFIDINAAACSMRGQTREEILALGPDGVLAIPREELERTYDSVIAGGEAGTPVTISRRRADGAQLSLELRRHAQRSDTGWMIVTIVRDVTDRKADEAKIHRLTQLYSALSQCNEAIVRTTSEEELFPAICRSAVQYGGMQMAWIGLVDPDTAMIRPVAGFGDRAEEFMRENKVSVDPDIPEGQGTTGTAIRENHPVWSQDFQNDPLVTPWQRERRAHFGWAASAALPLHRNGVPVGTLNLYAGVIGAFDDAARGLLLEMATDIGFALDNFSREAARARAQDELRTAEEQFRGLVEQSLTGIYITQDGVFKYANPRLEQLLGYEPGRLIGLRIDDIVVAEDLPIVQSVREVLSAGGRFSSYELHARRRDGSVVELGLQGSIYQSDGAPTTIGMAQDITEKKRAERDIRNYMKQLETAFMNTVEVATTLGEMRDPYTAGHQRRVAEIAVALGGELGFDVRRQEGLRVAGYLHDIGKITIPAEILSKPAKLSPIEYSLIQGHAQASYDVLKNVTFPWPVAEVAWQHHERIDGSGYPQGLKGDAILIEARIMAVADVVEAMSTHRPYRPGLGIDKALAEIERGRGTAYDPAIVDACLRLFREKHYAIPA